MKVYFLIFFLLLSCSKTKNQKSFNQKQLLAAYKNLTKDCQNIEKNLNLLPKKFSSITFSSPTKALFELKKNKENYLKRTSCFDNKVLFSLIDIEDSLGIFIHKRKRGKFKRIKAPEGTNLVLIAKNRSYPALVSKYQGNFFNSMGLIEGLTFMTIDTHGVLRDISRFAINKGVSKIIFLKTNNQIDHKIINKYEKEKYTPISPEKNPKHSWDLFDAIGEKPNEVTKTLKLLPEDKITFTPLVDLLKKPDISYLGEHTDYSSTFVLRSRMAFYDSIEKSSRTRQILNYMVKKVKFNKKTNKLLRLLNKDGTINQKRKKIILLTAIFSITASMNETARMIEKGMLYDELVDFFYKKRWEIFIPAALQFISEPNKMFPQKNLIYYKVMNQRH